MNEIKSAEELKPGDRIALFNNSKGKNEFGVIKSAGGNSYVVRFDGDDYDTRCYILEFGNRPRIITH